jgi:hypothetical protein
MGIDDESSHPELCSEVAGGVTRTSVSLFREPDAGNLPVRFDEREQEPEPSQTGLRRRGESQLNYPPGDYSHCACSRLYSPLRSKPLNERYGLITSVTQPSGCSIGAVLGQCIEGNRRAWGSLVNSVDDGFEYCKTLGRQAHASSDYHTIVPRRT